MPTSRTFSHLFFSPSHFFFAKKIHVNQIKKRVPDSRDRPSREEGLRLSAVSFFFSRSKKEKKNILSFCSHFSPPFRLTAFLSLSPSPFPLSLAFPLSYLLLSDTLAAMVPWEKSSPTSSAAPWRTRRCFQEEEEEARRGSRPSSTRCGGSSRRGPSACSFRGTSKEGEREREREKKR